MTDSSDTYDVVVIGAGGAGLRAAIEARAAGLRTAVICKSLFGKAHTVMAEGGIAARMGNVNTDDNWQVHFRDTMRGGKFLNHWRMAELHAQEAPDRVWELEAWGALFDRTQKGRISQRNFGGHEYPRLAHVGDRTGLELIRTLQQKIVSLQQEDARELGDSEARIKVFAECTITELLKDGDRIAGAFGYWRESGSVRRLRSAGGGAGDRRDRQALQGHEQLLGVHRRRPRAGAARPAATLINMEFVQFHPTGMVWPPSVKGILVTESVRGDGGVLTNSEGRRFMFDYVPEVFRNQYAETEAEGRRLVHRRRRTTDGRRSCYRATRSLARSTPRSRPAAGRPTAACSSTSARGCPPRSIKRKLPSMYHQFKELADVDITAAADGGRSDLPLRHGRGRGRPGHGRGRGRARPVRGGRGRRRDARLEPARRQLVVGPARVRPTRRARRRRVPGLARVPPEGQRRRRRRGAAETALAPFTDEGGENPYAVHQELQQTMNDLVGIIRRAEEIERALDRLHGLKQRAAASPSRATASSTPAGTWRSTCDHMLLVSECVARAALRREESRGGHTRDDFPGMNPNWRQLNLICRVDSDAVQVDEQPLPTMPTQLLQLFDRAELSKYMLDEELTALDRRRADGVRRALPRVAR